MNLKCLAVSAFFALTFSGSYCTETSAVAEQVKQNAVYLTEAVENGRDFEIAPTKGTVSYSTAISSGEPDTFLQAYFNCLKTNMGENYKGSCGYVALGMLLSYYDTFLNDDIIPEQYDVVSFGSETDMIARHNSPGIYNDVITASDCAVYNKTNVYDLSASEYFNFISKQVDYSLHAKLISIGETAGNYNYKSDKNPAGTTHSDRELTLISYLRWAGFSANDFSIVGKERSSAGILTSSDDVKKFVKSYIDKGYPVLVGLENIDTGARHACIAYSYDDNDVYLNMGWSGGNEHVPVSLRYNRYNSAIIIDWKLAHEHTNNYAVRKSSIDGMPSTKFYCYDDSHIVTSGHRHQFNNRYEQYNSSMHAAYCLCGQHINEFHSFNVKVPVVMSTSKLCEHCGYYVPGGGGSEIV